MAQSSIAESPVFTDAWNTPQRLAEEALKDHWCVVIVGGNRSGKTFAGMRICTKAMLGAYEWCREPASIATVSLAKNQAEGALQEKIEHFFLTLPEGIITGKTTRENLTSPIKLSNASRYTIKTQAQGWKVFQGAEYDLVHFDECPDRKGWKEMMARVKSGSKLRFLVTMTPTEGLNWFYYEILERAEARGVKIISAPVFSNGEAPCYACGKNEYQWEAELEAHSLLRESRFHTELKGLCEVCHTFGVSPRILPSEVSRWEQEYHGPELAIRLYGELKDAQGDRVFRPAEIRAIQCGALNATYEGGISYWQRPVPGHPYVAGVDAAEGLGGDHSDTAQVVLDAGSGVMVAMWADNVTPVYEYEGTVKELTMEYAPCELVIESASQGKTLIEAFRHSGLNLYRQRNDGSANMETTGRLGWWSAGQRRDSLLRNLTRAIRMRLKYHKNGHVEFMKDACPPGSVTVRDAKTIAQLAKLRYNQERSGKIDVPDGQRDDRVIATALAHEARVGRHWVPWTVPKSARETLDPYTAAVLEAHRNRQSAQRGLHPDLRGE